MARFWTTKPRNTNMASQVKRRTDLPSDLVEIFNKIGELIVWKGPPIELLRRIIKIGSRRTFTTREEKLLRKLVNQQKRDGYTDYHKVLYYFPGKTVGMLESKYLEKKYHDFSKSTK